LSYKAEIHYLSIYGGGSEYTYYLKEELKPIGLKQFAINSRFIVENLKSSV